MKLLKIAAALGTVAWLNRKYGATLLSRYRSAKRVAGANSPNLKVSVRHPQGTRPSAASAASGKYRDDRDVPSGVGVLRDEAGSPR